MNFAGSDAASIGIIGGADGPTSIFITSRFSLGSILFGGLVAGAILLVIVLLVIRGKK